MNPLHLDLERLKSYWKEQGIGATGKTFEETRRMAQLKHFQLPQDFINYFTVINGMGDTHYNDTDQNGFCFYQLEALIGFDDAFVNNDPFLTGKRFFLFADYLQKCWSYVLATEITNPESYTILVYLDSENYKIVARSLSEFIGLYLLDSPVLYA
jgi:hypothetical protein